MKLEVGMYLRTKDGKIAKFIKYDEIDKEQLITSYYQYSTIWIGDIASYSFNIIDLIQVGDYVNGEKVGEVIKKEMYHFGDGIIIKNEDDKDIYSNFRYSKYGDIESIVTKEQFESISYKL